MYISVNKYACSASVFVRHHKFTDFIDMIFAILLIEICCLLVAGNPVLNPLPYEPLPVEGLPVEGLPVEDCYHVGSAHRYRGMKNTTPDKVSCIDWKRFSDVHRIDSFLDESYEAAANYCREPTGKREEPWCYYNEKGEWAYCGIPKCPT